MYPVLLIDNDKKYAASLRDRAYTFNQNIEIHHSQGLEEGISDLENNPKKFLAVILDGRGYLSEDKPKETDAHVHSGIASLKDLKQQGIHIPYMINTGYFEQFKDSLSHLKDVEVFDKSKSSDDLLHYLLKVIHENILFVIRSKYANVIEVFDKNYLTNELEKQFYDLVTCFENNDLSNQKAIAVNIRSIQEGIYKTLNEYYPNVLPDDLFENNKVKFNDVNHHLSGEDKNSDEKWKKNKEDYQGQEIKNIADFIYWTCGGIIHYSSDKPYTLSEYTLRSLIYGLCEQLLWYGMLISKNTGK